MKRDCPDGEEHANGGEGLKKATVKSVACRYCKRNMTTNFTQYNVLQILGEDQDMRTIKLYYLDDVLQN